MPDEMDPQAQPTEPQPDDDVEGHRGMGARVDGAPQDFMQTRVSSRKIDEDEDDVEGHFGHLKSPTSRGE